MFNFPRLRRSPKPIKRSSLNPWCARTLALRFPRLLIERKELVHEFTVRNTVYGILVVRQTGIPTSIDALEGQCTGLETETPYPANQMFDFARTPSPDCMLQEGVTKWLLWQVQYEHEPRESTGLSKLCVGVPIDHALRGSLRDWTERDFVPAPTRRRWADQLSGLKIWQCHLQGVSTFPAWMKAQRG